MVIIFIGFILGTFLGSFVKTLADRSLSNKTFRGRSYCQNCKHILQWYDLLPIISYIYLQGKCRYCYKKIGIEYLLVEILMGILIGFLFFHEFSSFNFSSSSFQISIFILDLIFKTFFISVLIALFLTDIKKLLIPDRIVIPAILIGFIFLFIETVYKVSFLYYYLSGSPIGRKLLPPYSDYFQRHALMSVDPLTWGVLMGLTLAGFFMTLIIITKGKGMGGGDVKLGGFLGLMLGFPHSILAVALGFFTGAIFSLGAIFVGKKQFGQTIAFGPFLVIGALIALFWGKEIVDWYVHFGS